MGEGGAGGDGRVFPWGNDADDTRVNVGTKSVQPVTAFGSGVSPFGALNMVGNVWEWVNDLKEPDDAAVQGFRASGLLRPPATKKDPWYTIRGLSYEQPTEKINRDWWIPRPCLPGRTAGTRLPLCERSGSGRRKVSPPMPTPTSRKEELRIRELLQRQERKRGFLVAFEGPDGAGKTTQRKLFKTWLRSVGHEVVTYRWNSSPLIEPVLKARKLARSLSPEEYCILSARILSRSAGDRNSAGPVGRQNGGSRPVSVHCPGT